MKIDIELLKELERTIDVINPEKVKSLSKFSVMEK
ncbi:MAG: hypothetical protein Lokiarch_09520 [Candidatus Lokiarchaeum sp. GC14_75]|nr:MAG: hypothetical protein Lokiarch_09520 [Candidatus Lokiarchaeum sp. GC14_75]